MRFRGSQYEGPEGYFKENSKTCFVAYHSWTAFSEGIRTQCSSVSTHMLALERDHIFCKTMLVFKASLSLCIRAVVTNIVAHTRNAINCEIQTKHSSWVSWIPRASNICIIYCITWFVCILVFDVVYANTAGNHGYAAAVNPQKSQGVDGTPHRVGGNAVLCHHSNQYSPCCEVLSFVLKLGQLPREAKVACWGPCQKALLT